MKKIIGLLLLLVVVASIANAQVRNLDANQNKYHFRGIDFYMSEFWIPEKVNEDGIMFSRKDGEEVFVITVFKGDRVREYIGKGFDEERLRYSVESLAKKKSRELIDFAMAINNPREGKVVYCYRVTCNGGILQCYEYITWNSAKNEIATILFIGISGKTGRYRDLFMETGTRFWRQLRSH